MKIELTTCSYNERRYGKPYIATVDFSAGVVGTPSWGQWCGQAGESGLLILDAEPGAIVMRGQRDNRNMKHSAPHYYQLSASGELVRMDTKAEAYKAWRIEHATHTA